MKEKQKQSTYRERRRKMQKEKKTMWIKTNKCHQIISFRWQICFFIYFSLCDHRTQHFTSHFSFRAKCLARCSSYLERATTTKKTPRKTFHLMFRLDSEVFKKVLKQTTKQSHPNLCSIYSCWSFRRLSNTEWINGYINIVIRIVNLAVLVMRPKKLLLSKWTTHRTRILFSLS